MFSSTETILELLDLQVWCLVLISITGPSVIPPSAHPTELPAAERELEFDYHLSIKIWS